MVQSLAQLRRASRPIIAKAAAVAYERRRGTPAERGYDARWRRRRAMQLRSEPLCRMCAAEKRITPATLVDHIIPLRMGGADEFANYQSLCVACHAVKTAKDGSRG